MKKLIKIITTFALTLLLAIPVTSCSNQAVTVIHYECEESHAHYLTYSYEHKDGKLIVNVLPNVFFGQKEAYKKELDERYCLTSTVRVDRLKETELSNPYYDYKFVGKLVKCDSCNKTYVFLDSSCYK